MVGNGGVKSNGAINDQVFVSPILMRGERARMRTCGR